MGSHFQKVFFSRVSSAGYLGKKLNYWIIGNNTAEPDNDEFKMSMIFKSMEGPLEAAPQLILQLYIITRAGLHWSLGGKIKHF